MVIVTRTLHMVMYMVIVTMVIVTML